MRRKSYTFLRFSLILIIIVEVPDAWTFTTYPSNLNKQIKQKALKCKKTHLFYILSTDVSSTIYPPCDL